MQRIVAVDLLRGLAVLGMFAAHVGDAEGPWWSASGWLGVADGRSAATFALLAGVSAALLSGGPRPHVGARRRHAVVRVLARALLLWPLGAVMIALGTPVAVILPTYAVMFALVSLALGWRRRTLLAVAGLLVVLGPVVWVYARAATATSFVLGTPQPLDVLVGAHYPAVVWMAYLLVGVALGRTDLAADGAAPRLALTGLAAAVVGYGVGALGSARIAPQHTVRRALLAVEPHANSAPEVVGNIGVSLLLLAGCLVVSRYGSRLAAPLAATGALALTAYCAQLVAIAVLGDGVVWNASNVTLAAFVLVTLATTWAWRATLGRGPLERLLHEWSTVVADTLVPAGRRLVGVPAGTPPPPPPPVVTGAPR
ncbi:MULTISPECIES: heparan-alpha-glucosaminide N-acetyltransferase domain-containing protein [unclassified Actinotalea]|uniref:heparan-alpha-glucosaminide N-acetyltransferase domain-containing protein n=1 Tax=unclassified Actinotalea TaxID=2638618 RepID=UPI0015F42079|nr:MULTISPECIES: heparan-alpha-glucosaminide N-acetyltransferase domain-containing protein [unclassified Actinotalea]